MYRAVLCTCNRWQCLQQVAVQYAHDKGDLLCARVPCTATTRLGAYEQVGFAHVGGISERLGVWFCCAGAGTAALWYALHQGVCAGE